MSTALYSLTWKNAELGFARHLMTIPSTNVVPIIKIELASQILLAWAVTFTKISVALLLLRIQQTKARTWCIYGSMLILTAASIAYTVITMTECVPLSDYWNRSRNPQLGSHCRDPKRGFYTVIGCSSKFLLFLRTA